MPPGCDGAAKVASSFVESFCLAPAVAVAAEPTSATLATLFKDVSKLRQTASVKRQSRRRRRRRARRTRSRSKRGSKSSKTRRKSRQTKVSPAVAVVVVLTFPTWQIYFLTQKKLRRRLNELPVLPLPAPFGIAKTFIIFKLWRELEKNDDLFLSALHAHLSHCAALCSSHCAPLCSPTMHSLSTPLSIDCSALCCQLQAVNFKMASTQPIAACRAVGQLQSTATASSDESERASLRV